MAESLAHVKSSASTASLAKEEKKKSGLAPGVAINGDFIRKGPESSEESIHVTAKDKLQSFARRITTSQYSTQVLALVILFDTYCNCADIDARAINRATPEVFQLGSLACLILYTMEALAVLFGYGTSVLKDSVYLIDLGVILCGFIEMILDVFASNLTSASFIFSILRMLRLVRVMRLLRLLRKSRALRELQKLVIMMSTCIKTLIWSFVFLMVIMTVWAMLMVEMVHPRIQEMLLNDPTLFGDCDQCTRATRSVMDANLLLFKTVIAGDSWGRIAVPVIESHPATAIIFMGSLLTLVFGVLNLIVAVVVDTFADARDRDILNLAEEMEQDLEADKRFLERIFHRIDRDHTGQVSLEQLVEGARRDPEFQSRLRVMDIDEADLVQLFDMIDADGSGFIDSHEFIRPLSRWVHDSKTAPRFIKYNLIRTMQQQEEIKQQQAEMRQAMENSFSELFERAGGAFLLNGGSSLRSPGRMLSSHSLEGITCWEPQITEAMESIPEMEVREPENDVPQSELPEQPNSSDHRISFKSKFADETSSPTGASLLDAMERLEKIVLDATELALRQSAVSIKNAFTDLARNQLRTQRNPSKGTQREETAELHPVNDSAVSTMTKSPGNSPTHHVTIPKTSTISAVSAPSAASAPTPSAASAASAACESKELHKFRRRPHGAFSETDVGRA